MDSPAKEPSNFIGNNNIERFMFNSIHSNKLHHAYLLSGVKGLGKATFAYRCAKYILSDSFKKNMNIDNSEKTTKLIESDSHPDFIVLKKDNENEKSLIEIDQVRNCINFFNHTPILGGYKICIIDSLDEMNINSKNALLKLLEEPPQKSLFFIISHNKDSIMPTIKSRCLNLQFRKFSNDEIESFIKTKISIDEVYDLRDIIDLSNGSIGRALELIKEDSQEINLKVRKLFNEYSDEYLYELENFLRNSNKLDLFFELSIVKIDKLIREFVLKEHNRETEKIDKFFLVREKIQKIYYEGKKYNNLNNHIILDLILLIKKSLYI
ncbi:AAA family ATPase [OCS116 cluster bacterium]|nr:AAA family ATPase [OCS116 cluster bacterium]